MSKYQEGHVVYWADPASGPPKTGEVTEVIHKMWEGPGPVHKLPRWLWKRFMRRVRETCYTVACTDGRRYSMRESQLHSR